jgi:hypothetical protein
VRTLLDALTAISTLKNPALLPPEPDVDGGRRTVRSELLTRSALRDAICAADECGVVLTDVRLTEPSLESVFLARTGRGLRDG